MCTVFNNELLLQYAKMQVLNYILIFGAVEEQVAGFYCASCEVLPYPELT